MVVGVSVGLDVVTIVGGIVSPTSEGANVEVTKVGDDDGIGDADVGWPTGLLLGFVALGALEGKLSSRSPVKRDQNISSSVRNRCFCPSDMAMLVGWRTNAKEIMKRHP
jgi:hypothetical protein